ncbi:hypothetical protein IGI04_036377 [Brassica rapa subsp. trilocularis]|uniref:Retrotransposon gag domain-containing protein n=1 Tax=Brassica rapa subsp. trilocularis TaxID=1813537 RepID=A0ABQ7LEB3_BRACM|nr:hypothetical protein IGI04_036377 [Brassica rapa subsp. trilocularis]
MKRGFQDPSRKEPAGLCTIRRPKRDVSIDTLQAASIDSVSQASNDTIHHVSENTIHRGTIHPGTIHRGTVHHNTIHPSIVHRDTIHRNTIYLPSIDTVHPVSVDTIHIPSIDTVHLVSVATVHLPSINTVHIPSLDTVHTNTVHPNTVHRDNVHPNTVHPNIVHRDTVHPNTFHRNTVHRNTIHQNTIHRGIVPPMTNTSYGETEKVEALILKIYKKGIWRDDEGRPCSLTGQLINAEGNVISDVIDVAETNTFNLTSQWYDWGSEDPFYGLLIRIPKMLSRDLRNHIICKIFPYCLSRDAFSWFSKLQPRSLTCWKDIKEAFIGKFFSEAVATRSKRLDKMIKDREKGIMITENGDIGTPTTYVKQPDIQVHHADESKQKDELNREKLVNHDTVKDDEYHVSGEQSKVEEADTKDPTSASIDSSNSESIDIRTSEMIDTYICHRSIPSTIPDATSVYVRTGRPKTIRDYNSPEDAYAKRSALRRSALQNIVLELHPAYISLVGQHYFYVFPHEDSTSHLETFVDLASTIKCNGVSEDYYFCKLFPYSLAGDAAHWLKKLPLGSLTTWNDIRYAFLNEFLYDATANLEIETRYRVEYMVEDDEQHESGKLSTVGVAANISGTSSSSIDTLTITSIITPTSSSIDPSTSEMIDTDFCHRSISLEIPERSSCPQDIANSTQESIDESSCDLTLDVDKVTLKDFLELEEWLRQKLDDQPASGKGLENSLKADDIDRHKPDEIDRHPPYDIDLQSPSNIDQHTPDCIDRHPPNCIDRHSCLDELSGYPIEPGTIEEIMHMSKTSHIDVPEHLRPPICAEEAVGICKRVKMIHDPVKIMVPCAVFEAESPIPPDKSMELSSYGGVFDDNKYVEASQRGLRFRDELDEGPAGAPSSDISKSKSIDTNTSSSIDTDQIPSIDTRHELRQNEYKFCGNIFYGDTTTHSDKSGGKKWRNWKKTKRINEGSQISLIPHFSDDARKYRVRLHKSVGKKGRNWKKRKRTKGGSQLLLTPYFSDSIRKSRVRSKCFSHPYAKLKTLLIAEVIDKGEGKRRGSEEDEIAGESMMAT